MTKLRAGAARVCITPPLGISLQGYYFDRRADTVLDDLYARALYVSDGASAWVLISADLIAIDGHYGRQVRERAATALGLTPAQVMLSCSHTHTGPVTTHSREIGQRDDAYLNVLVRRLVDAAVLATRRAQPATLHVGEGSVSGIAFNRRYRMEDGSVVTNPGIGNPAAGEAMGPIDLRLKLALFRGDDGPLAVLTNYALHADMVGGTGISGDWPGAMARIVESHLPAGCPVLFTNGASGDINHIDVFGAAPAVKGYDQAQRTGQIVASEVLAALERLRPAGPGAVAAAVSVDPYPLRPVTDEALDNLKPGEVVVATTNGTTRSALWGELLSTATRARGGRGLILDGFTRDTRQIRQMQFPVFATGILPTDSKGRCDVIAYNVPIAVGGVLVQPGDLIFADFDGGVVVPKAIADEVVERSLEKVAGENKVRDALKAGMKVTEAFKTFGIL